MMKTYTKNYKLPLSQKDIIQRILYVKVLDLKNTS